MENNNWGKKLQVRDITTPVFRLAYQVTGLGTKDNNQLGVDGETIMNIYDQRQLTNCIHILNYLEPNFYQVNQLQHGKTPFTYLAQFMAQGSYKYIKPFVLDMIKFGAFLQMDAGRFLQAVNEGNKYKFPIQFVPEATGENDEPSTSTNCALSCT